MSTPLDRFTHRPVRVENITFPLDPVDADRHREARQKVSAAKESQKRSQNDTGYVAVEEAEAALADLEASMVTVTFTVKAIGDRRVEELMLAHPPTKEQRTEARKNANGDPKAEPDWNPDSFPIALLAEAIETIVASDAPDSPQDNITEAQVKALWESTSLSTTDRSDLFMRSLYINQAPSRVEDLGKD